MATLTPPAHSLYQKQLLFILLAGMTILLIVLWSVGDDVPREQVGLAVLLICLSVAPLMVHLLNPQPGQLPLMPLNCLFYTIAIAVHGFFFLPEMEYARTVSHADILSALRITILGLGSQILAYYLAHTTLRIGRPVRFMADLTVGELRTTAWLLVLFRIFTLVVPGIVAIPSMDQLALLSAWASIAILYTLFLEKKLPFPEKLVLFGMVLPVEIVVRLNSGALADVMLLLALLSLVQWIVVRRVAWLAIGFSFLTLIILNPVKIEYRHRVSQVQTGVSLNMLEKSKVMVELTSDYWLTSTFRNAVPVTKNVSDRINHLVIFSAVIEATPSTVPYLDGESLTEGCFFSFPAFFGLTSLTSEGAMPLASATGFLTQATIQRLLTFRGLLNSMLTSAFPAWSLEWLWLGSPLHSWTSTLVIRITPRLTK